MTNGTRRVPGGRQCAQRPYFLFAAKEASAGEEYRGIRQRFPFRCNKTKTMDCKTEVIVEPKTASPQSFSQAKTAFVRIACTSCPPSNLPIVVGSLPGRYLRRGLGPL